MEWALISGIYLLWR